MESPKPGRLLDLPAMKREVALLKSEGKKVVFTNGCFDILHLGHATYLDWARKQGDVLVVGMNSDLSVRRNKGPKRPIVPERDRALLLLALKCVDYVVIFDDETPVSLIGELLPDVLVKGKDWAGKVAGAQIVEKNGGKVMLADLVGGRSTTGVIERVLEAYSK